MVKLFAPLAGAGALAPVVATAWLLLPDAAAASSRFIVESLASVEPAGATAVPLDTAPGAVPAGAVPWTV
jgi:hypothetical protein